MTRKQLVGSPGTVVVCEYTSAILADNPLGDPHVRKLAVWLPPQYDEGAKTGRGRRFPVLYDLVGFTGSGLAHVGWKPFGDNVAERAARLIRERKMGPVIVVFPDCFTCLGGNQYVNSAAIGNYADYLTRELIPFVDREFRTLASREHRGCFGKSSGGYGAIIHGMKYAKHWGAIADHSGDAYFDFVYRHDWPNTLNELGKYREPGRREGRYDALAETRRAQDSRRRRRRRARQALPRGDVEEGKAVERRGARDHERLHGRDLRSGREGAARISPAVRPRDRRTDRRALEELAEARPDQPRGPVQGSTEVAARDLHRLRLARPVPHPLRRPGYFRSACPRPASGTPTRSSTTTIPTSTTGWT